ncbi:hypothetical protein WKK05_15815 [Nostoc sp. UHCC 0302]|uniref:hypothetical protein n=1 Tax=Nostoc sp. UHCC 0302 TaxID=3134896 RepID=UPI00311CB357
MNFKQIISIGFLALGAGFFSIKTVNAQGLSVKASVSAPSTAASQPSSFTIAQLTEPNSPLYGNWKLTFSIDGIIYESILRMQGYSGTTRTRYFNPNTGKPDVVDQTMELKSSSSGLILLGYNPVYGGTTLRHPTYIPDNFLFQIRPDGSLIVFTCDRNKRCSSVDLEVIR